MKKILLALAFLSASPPGAYAQAISPYLGQIMIFNGDFCPIGWVSTQGQILSIQQYQALFSLLGITYGGNGTTNFALPKTQTIRTKTGAPLTQCIALSGVYPARS